MNTMNASLPVVASAVAMLIAASFGHNAGSTTWTDAVLAKGGLERLLSIRTVVVRSISSGKRVTDVTVLQPPRYLWGWVGGGGPLGNTVSAFDLETKQNCVLEKGVGVPGLLHGDDPAADYMIAYQLAFLLETNWLHPHVREERSGRNAERAIVVSVADRLFELSLDPKTMLPRRLVDARNKDWLVIEMDSYERVQGLMMPTDVKLRLRGGAVRSKGRYEYEFNADVAAEAMSCSPALGVGPDAWRR